MIASFVLMGGFLYWLSATAEPTPPPAIDEDRQEQDRAPIANLVAIDDLARTPADYVAQMVRVENTDVAQALGDITFFVNTRQPVLVRMHPDMVAAGEPIPSGYVTVVGRVREMNDSIVSDWVGSGSVSAGNQMLVEFASHYILTEAILPGQAPAPAGETTESGASPSGDGN